MMSGRSLRIALTLAASAAVLAFSFAPAVAVGAPLQTPSGDSEAPGDVLTPAEVIDLGEAEDGARITVRGEAIGEALRAVGGGEWVNVGLDGSAIGLWGPKGMSDGIDRFGRYRVRGAIVEAEGTYNAACDQHGGDRDVHVDELRVIESSEDMPQTVHPAKLLSALGLGLLTGVLALVYRIRKHRAF